MTIWDRLCCVGYGISARTEAIRHMLRGHDVRWRTHVDLWIGCLGGIDCHKCPDTEGGGSLTLWIRTWGWISRLAMWWCGRQGHRGLEHPIQYGEPLLDKWYCTRCLATVETR